MVTSVDVTNHNCKVVSNLGHNLNYVKWMIPSNSAGRGTDTNTPRVGDKVVIDFRLGYPLIIGYLPRLGGTIPGESSTFSHPITYSSETRPDTGSFGPENDTVDINPGVPKDFVPGDKVLTTEGGNMLSLLRNGTTFLRAAPLSQLILSKYDDLVRIVSRNYDLFTDLGAEVVASIRGRTYKFLGAAKKSWMSRRDLYQYKEYLGDVALGELKGNDYDLLDLSQLPAESTVIKKVVIQNYLPSGEPDGATTYVLTMDLSGKITQTVTKKDDASKQCIVTAENSKYTIRVGQSFIEVTPDHIKAYRGSSSVEVTDGKVEGKVEGSTFSAESSNVTLASNGHSVIVNASGVSLS